MLRETARATSQILQVLICIYNIEVNGSTIRKRLSDCGLFVRFYRRMPPLSKENMAIHFKSKAEICADNQTHISTNISYQVSARWWKGHELDLFCSQGTWELSSH